MRALGIKFANSISCQNTFNQVGFFDKLNKLDTNSEALVPNYKNLFQPSQLRRMSPILKAGLSLAISCKKACRAPFDSIIIGTGLGCLTDTGKFLQNINLKTGDSLSPTSFIQSTHNTIAGQISILLNNKGYNMTHSQNNLSFEMSLLDAMTEINEGKRSILVGGIDEAHPFLEEIKNRVVTKTYPNTLSAAFFVLDKADHQQTVQIKSVYTDFSSDSINPFIERVCKEGNIDFNQIDLVLHSGINSTLVAQHARSMNYLDYTGYNLSSSALATHFAYDFLKHNPNKTALIINHLCTSKSAIFIETNDQA